MIVSMPPYFGEKNKKKTNGKADLINCLSYLDIINIIIKRYQREFGLPRASQTVVLKIGCEKKEKRMKEWTSWRIVEY